MMTRNKTNMKLIVLLPISLLLGQAVCNFVANDQSDLDFDIEDEENQPEAAFASAKKEQALQDYLLRAMQQPAMREQIGQVIPILRVMSPQQRLTLAALVSAQIRSPHKDIQSLSQVADMFSGPGQSSKNVTEQLLLPISVDIAKMFRGLAAESGRSWRSAPAPWTHENVELNPKYQKAGPSSLRTTYNSTLKSTSLKKPPYHYIGVNSVNRRSDSVDAESPDPTECDYLTTEICQEVAHYPEEQILSSIHKQMNLMEPFLTEFEDMKQESPEEPRLQRRQDVSGNEIGTQEGFMCPSTVKYAKPKRARTTSGVWKYVVNTGDYTQTLRIESCSNPGASCAYLNDHYRSICNQVYNYHRLMTWDEKRGLHMDVFKVPSCCSCHVQGYTSPYPPNDYPFAEKRKEILITAQSNSGVKREIPRPGHGHGRPSTVSHYQSIYPIPFGKGPNQWGEFHPENSQTDYQKFLQHQAQQNSFLLPNIQQPVHLGPSRPPLQNSNTQQIFRHPQPNFSPGQLQTIQQSHQPHIEPTSPTPPIHVSQGFNAHNPHIQTPNVENTKNVGSVGINAGAQGSESGLVDHLVPPGPPLPLDFDRPRPNFDQRKRHNATTRFPEHVKLNEMSSSHKKRGNQRYEQILSKPAEHARPTRPIIPVESIHSPPKKTTDGNRGHASSDEGGFGSKLRGKKPQQPNRGAVFVTPTPLPAESTVSNESEKAVRVTPKTPVKKINYNYHPIIDFFVRDGPQQYDQHQQIAQQRYDSNREWTPMVR